MMEKRGFNQQEAMAYLGVKRRTWDTHFAPKLRPTRFGTSLIYDRVDLDQVFERMKNGDRNERPGDEKGANKWADKPESTRIQTAAGESTRSTKALDFTAASALIRKRKTG